MHRKTVGTTLNTDNVCNTENFADVDGGSDYKRDKESGGEANQDDTQEGYVRVKEHQIAELWIPGRVLHLYAHRGRFVTWESFRDLRIITKFNHIPSPLPQSKIAYLT